MNRTNFIKTHYKEILQDLWDELDYWCDAYKYVNDVTHNPYEITRISKNIRNVENAFNTIKILFKDGE